MLNLSGVRVAVAVAVLFGLCVPVLADDGARDVSETVWYQGFLADVDTGEPVNATVDIYAELYDQVAGGAVLWGAEAHLGVEVTEGWFNIELGSSLPLIAFGDPPYYLSLVVAGEVLEPRQKLASVPMALRSAAADSGDGDWTVSGYDVYRTAGEVGIGTAAPTYPLHVMGNSNSATTVAIENQDTGANSAERVSFKNEDGTVSYIACYDDDHASYASTMVIANNRPRGRIMLKPDAFSTVMIDSTGNVGIGVSSPTSKLDVSGTAEMLGFKLTTSPTDGYVLTSDSAGNGTWQAAGGGGDSDWTVDGNDMYSAVTGNVGIGTSAPASKLEVDGTIESSGLKMTTNPSVGDALTADSQGNATWKPQHIIDVHNETSSTTIGSSATQFDDTQVSLTVPGPGYIICTSTVRVNINHANNSVSDYLQINHSESPSTLGDNSTMMGLLLLPAEPIGGVYRSFCISTTHQVFVADTYTYYLVGRMISGQDSSDEFWNGQMTAVYYPN